MSLDMNLVALIDTMNERPIAFNKHYVELGCGITGALMLSQLVYWTKKTKDQNGWVYKTNIEWTEETGLTRSEQNTARKNLRELGFISEVKKGVPCKVYFRVEYNKLYEALIKLAQKRQTSCTDHANQLHESEQLNAQIPTTITESTTENTTESTTYKKQVKKSEPKKPQKFSFENELLKLGANEQFVSEFMEVRKAKKAVDSETAFKRFISEQQKSDKSLDDVLETCVVNSWKSFNASWGLQNNNSVQLHNQDHKRGSTSKQKPFSDTKQDNVNRWRRYGEETGQNDTLVTVNSEQKLIGGSHE